MAKKSKYPKRYSKHVVSGFTKLLKEMASKESKKKIEKINSEANKLWAKRYKELTIQKPLFDKGEEMHDLAVLKEHTKALRTKRKENFESRWLGKLKKQTKVTKRSNGSYTFNSKYGIIDFYPKANKLLIRKQSKWVQPALKFIISNNKITVSLQMKSISSKKE